MYLGYRNKEVFACFRGKSSKLQSIRIQEISGIKLHSGGAIESKEMLRCICDCVTLILF